MRDWDMAYYGRVFNAACRNSGMPVISVPEGETAFSWGGKLNPFPLTNNRRVQTQNARFDPSKGIFDVVESYEKFYNRLTAALPDEKPPKLLICGHGSIDDPDGSLIYDAVVSHIEHNIPYLIEQICVMRLGPSDQILNALMSKAKVALQLSTREGFEVKVSEAVHKGTPIIATRAGGIPLQVENNRSGFLVDVGDTDAVAEYLFKLFTDEEFYGEMSRYEIKNVCDEVSTVGNALNWLYLASKMSKHEPVRPNGRFINDMAREEAGFPYEPDESRLTRAVEVENMG